MVSHHLWRTKPGMRQNEHILCTATNASQPARQEGAFDVSIIRTCPPHGWSLPFNNNKHRQSSRVRTFRVRWNRGPSPDSFVCILYGNHHDPLGTEAALGIAGNLMAVYAYLPRPARPADLSSHSVVCVHRRRAGDMCRTHKCLDNKTRELTRTCLAARARERLFPLDRARSRDPFTRTSDA